MDALRIRAVRKYAWLFCWFVVCLSALVLKPAEAHQHEEAAPATASALLQKTAETSMRIDVNLVLVPVVVTDALNRPVMGLEKQNFALYQDNEQQQISYFSTEVAPISVGLLLDLSKSMTEKFSMERAAVSEFFKNANRQDDYFVITFSDRPKLLTISTQSIEAIQSSLGLQAPDGNTALFDAISDGTDRMRSARYRRKALLIISDGGDNHSRHHLGQIKRMVQDSDVEVYAIGIFDTGPFKSVEESLGRRWLSKITDASGGRTTAVDDSSKIPVAAAAISREIRSRYVLGYRPMATSSDSSHRKIQVDVTSQASPLPLHAHYKSAYRALDGSSALHGTK